MTTASRATRDAVVVDFTRNPQPDVPSDLADRGNSGQFREDLVYRGIYPANGEPQGFAVRPIRARFDIQSIPAMRAKFFSNT